jgi:hypothetical protein
MVNPNLTDKQRAVISSIISLKDEQIISLIQDFRDNGELFIVEPLIDILFTNRSFSLKQEILQFVSDIKNPDAIEIIADSIQHHMGDRNNYGLVSACWQSNLDFSSKLSIFIEILCNSDYQTSFEAFTVIENSIGNVSQKDLDIYISTIESKLKNTPIEKQSLLTDMVVMLEGFKKNGYEGY